MDQIALPFRIALVAVLAIGAVWFVALRPKSASDDPAAAVTPPAATAPGAAGLGRAVDAAKGAVGESQASASAEEAATGSAPAGSGSAASTTAGEGVAAPGSPAAAAGPAKARGAAPAGDPSRAILRSLGARRVAVVLFYNPLGSDDSAVRRAVRGVDRFGGRVSVHSAPISKVGDYEAITRGVQVLQAPTVLVIGHDRKARKLVGLTDAKEIDQLVSDVGGAGFAHRVSYRAAVGEQCARLTTDLLTTLDQAATPAGSIDRASALVEQARTGARHLHPPRSLRAFNRTFVAYLGDVDRELATFRRDLASGGSPPAALTAYMRRAKPLDAAMAARAERAGISCR